jgi:hypothetical protein
MRTVLFVVLMMWTNWLSAQAQLVANQVLVQLEPGEERSFSIALSNPNTVSVAAQTLRAAYFSLPAPFASDFQVSTLSGPCGDWQDTTEIVPNVGAQAVIRFGVPELAAGAQISCQYRIVRLAGAQRNLDLAFSNSAPPTPPVLTVKIGVLGDLGAIASRVSSIAVGANFLNRYRVTFTNNSEFAVAGYGFGACDFPNVPRLRMNFPGGCNPNAF